MNYIFYLLLLTPSAILFTELVKCNTSRVLANTANIWYSRQKCVSKAWECCPGRQLTRVWTPLSLFRACVCVCGWWAVVCSQEIQSLGPWEEMNAVLYLYSLCLTQSNLQTITVKIKYLSL